MLYTSPLTPHLRFIPYTYSTTSVQGSPSLRKSDQAMDTFCTPPDSASYIASSQLVANFAINGIWSKFLGPFCFLLSTHKSVPKNVKKSSPMLAWSWGDERRWNWIKVDENIWYMLLWCCCFSKKIVWLLLLQWQWEWEQIRKISYNWILRMEFCCYCIPLEGKISPSF